MIDNGDLLNVNEDTAEDIIETHKKEINEKEEQNIDRQIRNIINTMKKEGALRGELPSKDV